MTKPEKSAQSWQGETGAINHSMLMKYVDDLQAPIYYIAGLPEMASAMRKLLAEAGVNEENIRAEEFSGFDLNRLSDVAEHPTKEKP